MRDLKNPRGRCNRRSRGFLTPAENIALVGVAVALILGFWLARHIHHQAKKPLPPVNSHNMTGAHRYQAKEMLKDGYHDPS